MELKPGYKQTEVGVIPEDWDVYELSELITAGPKNGYSGRCNTDERGTPTLSLSSTSSGQLVLNKETIKFLEKRLRPGSEIFLLNGDILVQRANTAELVGATAFFDGPSYVFAYPDLMMRLRLRETETAHWFWRYANSRQGKRYFSSVASGSTGSMPKISSSMLRQMLVPLPPLNERCAIIETLNEIDRFVASLKQALTKKHDIKQAAMQDLLTGKRRLPGFEGEWEVKRLGEISTISMGRTPSRAIQEYWGPGHTWLSIADLKSKIVTDSKEEITDSSASTMSVIPKGTLLMSFKLSIGKLCFAGRDLFTNEAICSFSSLKASSEFLYYVLGRTDFSLYGKQAVKGYTLNRESLQTVEVCLPSREEQDAIASVLSSIDDEILILNERREKALSIKQGVMQQLLTGKIRLT